MFGDDEWQKLCSEFAAADRDVRHAWAVIEAKLVRIDGDDAAPEAVVTEAELSALEQAKRRRDCIDERMSQFKRRYFADSGYGDLALSLPVPHAAEQGAQRV